MATMEEVPVGLLSVILLGGLLPGAMPVSVTGDWEVTVGPGMMSVGGNGVNLAEAVRVRIAPPETREVRDECYTDLPVFDASAPGWRRGARLRPLITEECSATGLLVETSLRVKSEPGDGAPFARGTDFEIDPFWATFGRVELGSIARRQAVFADYEYHPNRLDSITIDGAGTVRAISGRSGVGALLPPEVPPDSEVIANVWVTGSVSCLPRDSVFAVLPEPPHAPPAGPSAAETLLPKTLAKLRAGETVTAVAFGDSVTNGGGAGGNMDDWYQHQFATRLAARFPHATIRMLTAAWGGASSRMYLDAPAGGEHDFVRDVLEAHPDLVTLEFVNDAYLDEDGVRKQYAGILEQVRGVGAELVLITPHFVRPDWMKAASEKVESDPRPYVLALQCFANENGVALADASARWCGLSRRGIPYTTLLANAINHPDARGHALFADALMALFPDQ